MTTTTARLAEEVSSSKYAFLVVLSKQQALDIYSMRSPDAITDPSLQAVAGKSSMVAEMYRVSPKTIRDIWNRKTWAQVTRGLWTQEEVDEYELEQAHAKLPPAERQALKTEMKKRRGRPPGSKDSRPRRRRVMASDGSEQLLPSEGVMYVTVDGEVQVRPIPQAPTVVDVPLPAICLTDLNTDEGRSSPSEPATPDSHAEAPEKSPPAAPKKSPPAAEERHAAAWPEEEAQAAPRIEDDAQPESPHRHDDDEAREGAWAPASQAARPHWSAEMTRAPSAASGSGSREGSPGLDWMSGWASEGLLVPQTPPSRPACAPQAPDRALPYVPCGWRNDKFVPAGPTPGCQNTAPEGSVFHLAESILSGSLYGGFGAPGMEMLPESESADPYMLFLYEKCGVEPEHEAVEAQPVEEGDMWYFGA